MSGCAPASDAESGLCHKAFQKVSAAEDFARDSSLAFRIGKDDIYHISFDYVYEDYYVSSNYAAELSLSPIIGK